MPYYQAFQDDTVPHCSSCWLGFCTDWQTFYQTITENNYKIYKLEVRPANFSNKAKVANYFLKAAKIVDGLDRNTSAAVLSRACFHQYVNFGHVVAEDCSGFMKKVNEISTNDSDFAPDAAASGLRIMATLQEATDEFSANAVIVGRLPTPLDAGPKNAYIHSNWVYKINKNGDITSVQPNPDAPPAPHAVPPTTLPADVFYNRVRSPTVPYPVDGQTPARLQYPLPVWRAMPLRTVWILVLKSKGTNLLSNNSEHVQRVVDELKRLLRASPKRQMAFGVLTNMQECIFVAVCVDLSESCERYWAYHSRLIRRDALATELASFVSTNPTSLSMPNLKPVKHFHPTDYVGSGSTATVVSGVFRNSRANADIVLKTALDPGPLKLERWIIAYLLHCGVHPDTIPQIHREAQKVLSKDYQQHCTAFQRRYARVEITAGQLFEIWAILCSLHDVHVAHCDVRPPNMMYDEDKHQMVLIDFSGARIMPNRKNSRSVTARVRVACGVEIEELTQRYEPRCVNTSSFAVLLGEQVLPADEACSLIYAAIQINFRKSFFYYANLGEGEERYRYFAKRRSTNLFTSHYRNEETVVCWDIINNSLECLHQERESCTKERRTELVAAGVNAVYKMKILTPADCLDM